MKAISLDLRKRIVAAYKQGEGTQKELAKRFAVSTASVDRYLRLDREKGSLEATPWPGGSGRAIVKEKDRETILAWLKAEPDLTHTELAERFSKQRGHPIARSTMGAALLRLGITRKKSRSMRPNKKMKKS